MPFVESSESLKSRLHVSEVKTPILVVICIAALAAIYLVIQGFIGVADSQTFSVNESVDSASSNIDSSQAQEQPVVAVRTIKVHVTGAVVAPGVYEIADGNRVQDAVDSAGGFTPEAAPQALNCARVVQDGEQIVVPTTEEIAAASAPAPTGSTDTATTATASTLAGKIDINRATAAELIQLPGVGESTAAKIIASREAEGPFVSTEDLKRVSGIGDKKYEALADAITVG